MPDIAMKWLKTLAALLLLPWAAMSIAIKRESFIVPFVNMRSFQ